VPDRLTPDLLLHAYAIGVFPMAEAYDEPAINWYEPLRRGIFPLDGFHVPRSLAKVIRRRGFEIRVDHDFEAVIRACAAPTPKRPKTWLNETLIGLYVELARDGFAHSVEVWREGALAGGLYGLTLGGAFFGESMFSRVRDSSKIALVDLVGRLRAGGFTLLDAQFLTEHLARFGAIEISRADYLRRLRVALTQDAVFPTGDYPLLTGGTIPSRGGSNGGGSGSSGSAHSISQTS
jgi:leucyl/phenylalanyl-tRNA--protein transferase